MGKVGHKIRAVELSDLHRLISIYLQATTASPLEVIKDTIKLNITSSHLNTDIPLYFFVAYRNKKILAYSIARHRTSHNAYEIECICHKDFRRQGVTLSLIKHVIKKCRENGGLFFFSNIEINNVASIALFFKLGFKYKKTEYFSATPYYRFFLKLEHPHETATSEM